MRTSRLLALLPCAALAACGASTSSDGGSTTSPPPPVTTNDGSTLDFDPDRILATRMAVHTTCTEPDPKSAPFTDDDIFGVQVIESDAEGFVRSVAVNFRRGVSRGAPIALEIVPPTSSGPASVLQARTSDPATGVQLMVIPSSPLAEMIPLTSATVSVLAVATKDGEPLTARIELHFEDGRVLDATYSGPLTSTPGGCAGR